MRIALHTDTPQFFADIADVVRVFYGEPVIGAPEEDIAGNAPEAYLRHTHAEADGYWCESFSWTQSGNTYSHSTRAERVEGDLLSKRLLKRAIKLCCYMLLKRMTGQQPLWGALTGIRPTRLYYEQLGQGASPAQAEANLVEVFDLAPPKAALLGEVIESQRGLMSRRDDEVDVYVGIAFCTTRCTYCSFASGEIGDGKRIAPYLKALHLEISAARSLVEQAGLSVRAVYIGGGTPTALTCAQLDSVLDALSVAFPNTEEWTVEAGRPDTLDREKLTMLRRYPVTRISINPQTLQDATLARIGRAHTARQTVEAYALARAVGFDNINMDLIAALPGEGEAEWADTLIRAAALAPESLTIHTLAIKRASKLRDLPHTLCDARIAQRMVDQGYEAASGMGMRAYYLYRQKYMAGNLENVGYAKPGKACRYNIDIMEETTSILALGAGGISKRVFGAQSRIERAPNVSNIDHYIARIGEMIDRKRALWGFFPGV